MTRWIQNIKRVLTMGMVVCATIFAHQHAVAQQAALPMLESQAPSEQSSYANRVQNRKGVHDIDPNVYVYTPEFGKRFQMPSEWESTELKGVDAVAYRVLPSPYKTCGWGGDPKACRTDEVRCEMDLYFDHQKNPLPWDGRYPEVVSDHYGYSYRFIPGNSRKLRLPKHSNQSLIFGPWPFIDSKTGLGLGWQGGYWNNKTDSGGIYMGLASYEKEVFKGMALITLSGGCAQAADALWLSADNAGYKEKENAYKLLFLPQSWRSRVKEAQRESSERNAAFFRSEGEKALKALREKSAPNN